MARGSAQRVRIADVGHLGRLIDDLASNEAIALGALHMDLPEQVKITTKQQLNGLTAPHVIARTSDNIVFVSGRSAFALLDHDTKGIPPDIALRLKQEGGFWPALVSVLPALTNVAHLTRASTSAGLLRIDTRERVPGSDGLHVYVQVQDGSDIERFVKTLHERCWLAGLGWMMVGAGGQLLERSIVDRMVGAPERLVFEGKPVLSPPLAQDQQSRRSIVADGKALDTVVACPPLKISEASKLRDLQAKETHRLSPERARARSAYIKEQTARIVQRTGITAEEAAKAVQRQCDGVLLPQFVLPFDDQNLEGVTVADILADPFRFEGATLADPLEGVDYGRGKAKIMLRADGTPWIHSFAHGRTVYELKLDYRAVRAAIEKAPSEAAHEAFVKLAVVADLDDVELDRLVDLTKQRTGVGVRTIRSKFRVAQQENKKQRAKESEERRRAERRDPRPQIDEPPDDAEWLPQMQVLNDVLGSSSAPLPPMRDIEGVVTRIRKISIKGMHAFTSSDANAEEEERSEET
jgi:hypothetical protein